VTPSYKEAIVNGVEDLKQLEHEDEIRYLQPCIDLVERKWAEYVPLVEELITQTTLFGDEASVFLAPNIDRDEFARYRETRKEIVPPSEWSTAFGDKPFFESFGPWSRREKANQGTIDAVV